MGHRRVRGKRRRGGKKHTGAASLAFSFLLLDLLVKLSLSRIILLCASRVHLLDILQKLGNVVHGYWWQTPRLGALDAAGVLRAVLSVDGDRCRDKALTIAMDNGNGDDSDGDGPSRDSSCFSMLVVPGLPGWTPMTSGSVGGCEIVVIC